jgi:hypothetical protein
LKEGKAAGTARIESPPDKEASMKRSYRLCYCPRLDSRVEVKNGHLLSLADNWHKLRDEVRNYMHIAPLNRATAAMHPLAAYEIQ